VVVLANLESILIRGESIIVPGVIVEQKHGESVRSKMRPLLGSHIKPAHHLAFHCQQRLQAGREVSRRAGKEGGRQAAG